MLSLRRQARLRREYLYRKSLEGEAAEAYERKRRTREAIAEGRDDLLPLAPNDWRGASERHDDGAFATAESAEYDDALHGWRASHLSHVDDEYARAGERDPKVVITTSRDPSTRLAQFAKEVRLIIPNAQRLNRGHLVVSELVRLCRQNDVTDLVLLHETRGEPDALIVCHLPFGPTAFFSLSNVVMRHDIARHLRQNSSSSSSAAETLHKVSEAYPHLIFEGGFRNRLGQRVKNILRYLFPVPKPDSKRLMTFVDNGYDAMLSFRHHVVRRRKAADEEEVASAGAAAKKERHGDRVGADDLELVEAGPRFDMGLYQIRLGTVDQVEADDEWRLSSYTRAARKHRRIFG
ncbi:hypothetical protein CDCA_CDCA03G1099 [Cyanidium caldarium]|uniref:Brix domain-containing protein n=1 Tax=Cyanidium caldarium TaxID=2771 RepID=A0AAV9IS42_CYACA|nr:hypothetical protein CDCA_CDCA03G1099 [Cyanidium caldarium]